MFILIPKFFTSRIVYLYFHFSTSNPLYFILLQSCSRQNEVQMNKHINFHSLSKKWFLWSTISVLLSKCRVNWMKKLFPLQTSIHVLRYPCAMHFNLRNLIKVSKGNTFNPIFKEKVQGQKHPRRCIVAEPTLPSFRKPRCVGQNE